MYNHNDDPTLSSTHTSVSLLNLLKHPHNHPSLQEYAHTVQAKSIGTGVAPYLDEIYNRDALQVRIQVRAGSLMLRENVGRHRSPQWNEDKMQCRVCDMNVRESMAHFLLECPLYATCRLRLMDTLTLRLEKDQDTQVRDYGREVMMYMEGLTGTNKKLFLLDGVQGIRIPHVKASDSVRNKVSVKVEKTINNYLWLCWRARQKQININKINRQSHMNNDNTDIDMLGVSDMFVCDVDMCAGL